MDSEMKFVPLFAVLITVATLTVVIFFNRPAAKGADGAAFQALQKRIEVLEQKSKIVPSEETKLYFYNL
jgi:hypothetical protein